MPWAGQNRPQKISKVTTPNSFEIKLQNCRISLDKTQFLEMTLKVDSWLCWKDLLRNRNRPSREIQNCQMSFIMREISLFQSLKTLFRVRTKSERIMIDWSKTSWNSKDWIQMWRQISFEKESLRSQVLKRISDRRTLLIKLSELTKSCQTQTSKLWSEEFPSETSRLC